MILLLAVFLVQDADSWEYRHAVQAFVNRKTMEQKSPQELLALGDQRFRDADFSGAWRIYTAMAETLPSDAAAPEALKALKEQALFSVARCGFGAGDFAGAYRGFEAFLARLPDSDLSSGVYGAKWFLFQSALELAKVGTKEHVLGVALYKSSKSGVDLLHQALLRFPREPFTDDFYLALGDFFLMKGQLDDAEKEYLFILTPGQYEKTGSGPRAQLRLAQIYIRRFDAVEYDVKTLSDAKREYEKFLSSWGGAKGNPEQLGALELTEDQLDKMIAEANAGIAGINEKLAEKEWNMAGWYLWKGKPKAAKIYLNSIKSNYPRTSWATKATEKLEQMK